MNSEQGKADVSGLESLNAWQRSLDFAKRIYAEVVRVLPQEEKWGLASQLRRAAASIPANIAEGYGRYYYQEGIRFCYIARGSLYEVLTFLSLARDLKYIDSDLFESLRADVGEIRRIISGYIAYLKKNKPGQRDPGNPMILREASALYDAYAEEQP